MTQRNFSRVNIRDRMPPASDHTGMGTCGGDWSGIRDSSDDARNPTTTQFGAAFVPCIRIRAPKQGELKPAKAKAAKVPATAHGSKDATTDTDLIRQWWFRDLRWLLKRLLRQHQLHCPSLRETGGRAYAATVRQ